MAYSDDLARFPIRTIRSLLFYKYAHVAQSVGSVASCKCATMTFPMITIGRCGELHEVAATATNATQLISSHRPPSHNFGGRTFHAATSAVLLAAYSCTTGFAVPKLARTPDEYHSNSD